MTTVLLFVIIVVQVVQLCIASFSKRKGENAADIDDNLKKFYEAEKGKNLATKEDIRAITSEIENVKDEISFEKQRHHDFIKEREKRFLNILFHAETIANTINRLYVYGHNTQDASKVTSLIDEISRVTLLMRQESTVCIAAYPDVIGKDKSMTLLVDNIQLLSAELLTRANNVANNIAGYKFMFDKAQHEEGKQQNDTIKNVMFIGIQNNKLLDEPLQYKDDVNHAIDQYVLWLSRLYKKGLAIRYKVELIKDYDANQ